MMSTDWRMFSSSLLIAMRPVAPSVLGGKFHPVPRKSRVPAMKRLLSCGALPSVDLDHRGRELRHRAALELGGLLALGLEHAAGQFQRLVGRHGGLLLRLDGEFRALHGHLAALAVDCHGALARFE